MDILVDIRKPHRLAGVFMVLFVGLFVCFYFGLVQSKVSLEEDNNQVIKDYVLFGILPSLALSGAIVGLVWFKGPKERKLRFSDKEFWD